MKTLTLSEAKSGESEAIASFYKELNSYFIIHPPSEKQREAIELGMFFVLKDEMGKIVGATSMIATGRPDLVELANSGILKQFQGLGLQQILLMVRAASAAACSIGCHSSSPQSGRRINAHARMFFVLDSSLRPN